MRSSENRSSMDLIRDKSILIENDPFEAIIDLDNPLNCRKTRNRLLNASISKRTDTGSKPRMDRIQTQSDFNISFRSTKILDKVPN